MATINYNGMELEEVTTPQIFDPPKKCVCWCDEFPLNKSEAYVVAILPVSSNWIHRVFVRLQKDTPGLYSHCALLPDPPKPRRATNRELSRWLAQGNGDARYGGHRVYTWIAYRDSSSNDAVDKDIKVRKWEDTEWHEPDVFYMEIEKENT